jgi:hypothetical protein
MLLNKYIENVLDSLLSPILTWFKKRSWWTRATVVVLGAGVCYGIAKFLPTIEGPRDVLAGLRAAMHADVHHELWRQADRSAMEASLSNLYPALAVATDDIVDGKLHQYDAWAVAQHTAALPDGMGLAPDRLHRYFATQQDPDLRCWRRWKRTYEPCHLGATAWIVWSLLVEGNQSVDDAVKALVAKQHPDGWWPIYYPSQSTQANASTYATAVATLALTEYLNQSSDASDAKTAVRRAVDRSARWLLEVREEGRARWKDYPQRTEGRESLSVSGLALVALDSALREAPVRLHEQWIDELPKGEIRALDKEVSSVSVHLDGDRVHFDNTWYPRFAWSVIGTVVAYRSVDLESRWRAKLWLVRQLAGALDGHLDAESGSVPWMAAMNSLALRYALGFRWEREPGAGLLYSAGL